MRQASSYFPVLGIWPIRVPLLDKFVVYSSPIYPSPPLKADMVHQHLLETNVVSFLHLPQVTTYDTVFLNDMTLPHYPTTLADNGYQRRCPLIRVEDQIIRLKADTGAGN
jgi:hypothetical protein